MKGLVRLYINDRVVGEYYYKSRRGRDEAIGRCSVMYATSLLPDKYIGYYDIVPDAYALEEAPNKTGYSVFDEDTHEIYPSMISAAIACGYSKSSVYWGLTRKNRYRNLIPHKD